MSDQPGDDTAATAASIQERLDLLMGVWDERNLMGPLSLVLDGQAAISGPKQGWGPLRTALTAILTQHEPELLDAEQSTVRELIQTLNRILGE